MKFFKRKKKAGAQSAQPEADTAPGESAESAAQAPVVDDMAQGTSPAALPAHEVASQPPGEGRAGADATGAAAAGAAAEPGAPSSDAAPAAPQPATPQPAAPQPATPPSSGPGDKPWFVNFGSYSQRSAADNWAAKLQPQVGKVVVTGAEKDGRTFYRVRVVELPDKQAAEKVARALESEYGLSKLWVGKP